MNSKKFLTVAGVVLVVVGVLGFLGPIGPDAMSSWFGSFWYFDNYENWAHLVLGIVALLASYGLARGTQKQLVTLVGVIALFVGLWNIWNSSLLGAELQNPPDLLLHLLIGVWALWVVRGDNGKRR